MFLSHRLPPAPENPLPTTSVVAELDLQWFHTDNGQLRTDAPTSPLTPVVSCVSVSTLGFAKMSFSKCRIPSSKYQECVRASAGLLDLCTFVHVTLPSPTMPWTQSCRSIRGRAVREALPFLISSTLLHHVHQTTDLGHALHDRIQLSLHRAQSHHRMGI